MSDRGRWYEGDNLDIWLIAWVLMFVLYLSAHLCPPVPDTITVPGYKHRIEQTLVHPLFPPPDNSSGDSFYCP